MKTLFSLLIVVGITTLLAPSISAKITNYCNISTCMPKENHVLCKYKPRSPGPECGEVQKIGLSNAEIHEIVAKHNQLRRYVAEGNEKKGNPGPQPKATNMQMLSWDPELALAAETWAVQCHFGHDKCRNTPRFIAGQNVAYKATSDVNRFKVSSFVQSWYDEVKLFNPKGLASYRHYPAVGHYTQLVWATTKKVGCGRIDYNSDGEWNSTMLVCNYGPAGNMRGAPIYLTP